MTTTYRVQHRDIAREARMLPRQWILVRFYDYPSSARETARWICDGTYPAYQPAGHYQAECRTDPGRGFPVYVRYVGPKET